MKPIFLVLTLLFAQIANAAEVNFPTKHSPRSDIWIDYSDLEYVLSRTVLDMGPPTHKRAGRPKRDSMTRLYGGSRTASRHEGNRVAFHLFKDQHRDVIRAIRDGLLDVPNHISLEELSRNHQLAYFLNLHNSIVLVKMAEEYPVTNLEKFFDRGRLNAFITSEQFAWGDQQISLADIQDHVLANWKDPLVIYGFYMGAVGTPNIREEAFDGRRVYAQLRDNASNFINSVRGTQVWNGTNLRVSNYYERMSSKFPNFEDDVLRHIKTYAKDDFALKLLAVNSVESRIEDWNIADLYNGRAHTAGRIYGRMVQDIEGRLIGQNDLPIHVQRALKDRQNNFNRFDGRVDIEEVNAGTPEPADESERNEDGDDPDEPVIL